VAEADVVLHAAVDRVIGGANPPGHRISKNFIGFCHAVYRE